MNHMIRHILFCLFTAITAAQVSNAANVTLDHDKLEAEFHSQLHQLAEKCDELKLADQAQLTRKWIVEQSPLFNYAFLVPETDPLAIDQDASQVIKFWHAKLTEYRNAYADQLFQLAQQELAAHRPAVAYRLLHELLRQNGNHADARRILGYRQVSGRWRRPGVTTRSNSPRIAHPKFNWPARQYWHIDSAHFTITTNLSEEAGLELCENLEELYSVWQQMFFHFWSNEGQLAGYFNGRSPSAARKRFRVSYFRSQAEYVQHLTTIESQAAITLGIYLNKQDMVFLFHDSNYNLKPTWFHEVSHQLFHEYRSAPASVGSSANFWAIEAAALYMESLRKHDGYYTVGGLDASRLQFARNRKLIGKFYRPMNELTAMGQQQLQQDSNIRPLYSQAAGMAHFFMDGKDQSLRRPFIEYLGLIYHRRDDRRSLEKLTGTDFATLDQQYQQFLQVTDADLAMLKPNAGSIDLAIGKTGVTDASLPAIAQQTELDWLDLTGTQVSDAGIAHLKQHANLRDIGLAATQITDASLPLLAALPSLEELDISATRITDAGIEQLTTAKNLRILRLAVTQISDSGIAHLASMKQLQSLDLQQTKVTKQGIAQLRQALPKLEIIVD
ncbi:MAG: hypothetical protein COA78_05355 [Blastopirellula sp.]|nr:MAG: hypothetical protein COA78_05355 [Blastopirellula sp.]